MRKRLLLGFLAFAALLVVVLEVPLALSEADNARAGAIAEIESDGASLALVVTASLQRGELADASAVISRYARAEHAIVAVVAAGKLVLSAGAGVAEELEDPSTIAILASADRGRVAGEEGSRDPDDDLLYVAIPVVIDASAASSRATASSARGPVVLLVAVPAAHLHSEIDAERADLVLFGLALLVVAASVGTWLAVSLTRPLASIESTVSSLGAGALGARVSPGRAPPELRDLGTTVNEMADRIEELLQAQRAFVADASHQLRAPMTALRLRLENLEGSLEQGREAELTPLLAEVDRLSRVVDGLLELARTDGARPSREVIGVDSVLADRLEAWGPLAAERGISLLARPRPERSTSAPLLALDCPGHLEQVLDNLLANALDATPQGGSVSIGARRDGDRIVVDVADTGPGMSELDRVRAFDRFWRTEGARGEGTGLGLAIVAQLVRTSGGTARIDVSPSGGVDVVVSLERAPSHRARASAGG